jgi:hypothetical protein
MSHLDEDLPAPHEVLTEIRSSKGENRKVLSPQTNHSRAKASDTEDDKSILLKSPSCMDSPLYRCSPLTPSNPLKRTFVAENDPPSAKPAKRSKGQVLEKNAVNLAPPIRSPVVCCSHLKHFNAFN